MKKTHQDKILELIERAADKANETGTRVVLHYKDDGKTYTTDGYGGSMLQEDRDVHVVVAAEPATERKQTGRQGDGTTNLPAGTR